jgi:hypothetical protein
VLYGRLLYIFLVLLSVCTMGCCLSLRARLHRMHAATAADAPPICTCQ